MHSLRSAFAFASPRYAPFQTLFDLHAPFQYINQGDLVPNVPPRLFGYDDFLYEFTLDGWPYIAPDPATLCKYVYWLGFLASSRFLKNHSILTYRDGIKGALNSAQRSRLGRNDQHSLFPVPQSILVNHVACRLRSSVRSIREQWEAQTACYVRRIAPTAASDNWLMVSCNIVSCDASSRTATKPMSAVGLCSPQAGFASIRSDSGTLAMELSRCVRAALVRTATNCA